MTYPKDIKISQREQFALLNDPDFLNQAVTRFLQQFLEAEITSFLQAEPYERTGERTGYRNGYKPRTEATYASLFKDLKRRGLKGVQLIISDHHEGLQSMC